MKKIILSLFLLFALDGVSGAEYRSLTNTLDRAIDLYFNERFEQALEEFHQVLNTTWSDDMIDSSLLGQALCYAHLEERENVAFCLEQLHSHLNERCVESGRQSEVPVLPCVKYAQRTEPIPIPDCIDRVEGTSRSLRNLLKAVKQKDILLTFHKFVDHLTASGIRCCTLGTFWTDCVDPLIQKWDSWTKHGLPLNPYDETKR